MAKNIKRKGYIEFEDGIKIDIVGTRELGSGMEITTTDGLYMYEVDSEIRELYDVLEKPILKYRLPRNHLYKLYFIQDWTGITTDYAEVSFKQIVLFNSK